MAAHAETQLHAVGGARAAPKFKVVAEWQAFHGECSVYVSDFAVYWFEFTTLQWLAEKLPQVLRRLADFPVDIAGRTACEALVGRKIFYREIPAVIEDFEGERGLILIRADNEEKSFPPLPWIPPDDLIKEHRIRVDLFDPQLWWFRKEALWGIQNSMTRSGAAKTGRL